MTVNGLLAYGAAAVALSVVSAWAEANRESLLSCRFGAECALPHPVCQTYDLWHIVRYYPETDKYTLFDTLNNREVRVSLMKRPHLLVFDNMDFVRDGREHSGVTRLVVAENGQAAQQHAFFIEFEPDDWRFFSGENQGSCVEIKN